MRRIVQRQTTTIQITSVEVTWVGEHPSGETGSHETVIAEPPAPKRRMRRKARRKSNLTARLKAGPSATPITPRPSVTERESGHEQLEKT